MLFYTTTGEISVSVANDRRGTSASIARHLEVPLSAARSDRRRPLVPPSGATTTALADGVDNRTVEILLETVIQETVYDRIGTAVGVANQLQHRYQHSQMVPVFDIVAEQLVDVNGEERKPAEREQRDDNDKHAHDAFFLRQAATERVGRRRRRGARWLQSTGCD